MELFLTDEQRVFLTHLKDTITKDEPKIPGINTKVFINAVLRYNSYYTHKTVNGFCDQIILNSYRLRYLKQREL